MALALGGRAVGGRKLLGAALPGAPRCPFSWQPSARRLGGAEPALAPAQAAEEPVAPQEEVLVSEWDLLQQGGAGAGAPLGRDPSGDALAQLEGSGQGRQARRDCGALLNIPKVALMFLTRGKMHHERTWELWFRNARGLVPLAALGGAGGCSEARLEALAYACHPKGGAKGGAVQQQHLASVYLHVGSNILSFHGFPASSPFHGLDIQERVKTEWGTYSLVEATRALLRAAVKDPHNAKFMLVSEACIPLYPLPTLWVELMWEAESRIDACAATDEAGLSAKAIHRWLDKMETEGGITPGLWRKSDQWFTLNRKHVVAALEDTVVANAFIKHCFWEMVTPTKMRDCHPDEHYFATMLAVKGLGAETDCRGQTTHVYWRPGDASHPANWTRGEITPEKFRELRQREDAPTCDADGARVTAAAQFVKASQLLQGPAVCEEPPPPYAASLGHHCSLMARKFAKDVANAVTRVLADCRHGLYILNTEEGCRRWAARKDKKEKPGPS